MPYFISHMKYGISLSTFSLPPIPPVPIISTSVPNSSLAPSLDRYTNGVIASTDHFQRSLQVATRVPGTKKIGSRSSATCRGCAASPPVDCGSGATSAGCATYSKESSGRDASTWNKEDREQE